MRIRDFDPARDRGAVRRCFIELQEYERALDARLPEGERVVDAYLELMFERCAKHDGSVLVAELGGAVVGFVTILARLWSDEPDDGPLEFAYLADLVVLPEARKRGIGRALYAAAEEHARASGARWLRLTVKGSNAVARSFYESSGLSPYEAILEKRLA